MVDGCECEEERRAPWKSGDVEVRRWEIPRLCLFLSEGFGNSPRFTSLRLDGNTFQERGFSFICEALAVNSSIETLSLDGCSLSSTQLEILIKTLPSTMITTLSLWGNKFGANALETIRTVLPSCTNLQSLNIGDCGIGGKDAVQIIEAADQAPSMSNINLSFNIIEDYAAQQIVSLVESSSHLRTINMKGACIHLKRNTQRLLVSSRRQKEGHSCVCTSEQPHHRVLDRKVYASLRQFPKPLPIVPDYLNIQELDLKGW
eukprot:m.28191 g.28191  ORF g.28191 m.28191 type:complete len:260 (+) comp6024_c0_seq1:52-831(+)